MAKMTDSEIAAECNAQSALAVGALNSQIAQARAEQLRRFYGEMFGDEVAGQSKVVATATRDTILAAMPDLIEIIAGQDPVVTFRPNSAEDEDAVQQENEAITHIIHQMNNGFKIFHDWAFDALLNRVGYVKRYWDEAARKEVEEYADLNAAEASNVMAEIEEKAESVKWSKVKGGPVYEDPTTGAVVDGIIGEVPKHYLPIRDAETGEQAFNPLSFRAEIVTSEAFYRIDNVPPDEVRVAPYWTRLDFDGCPYHAHRRSVTIDELIGMGFKRDQVESLPRTDRALDSNEVNARFGYEQGYETRFSNQPDSVKEVMVSENYIRIDRDGDGIAELLRVWTSETGELLKWRSGRSAIDDADGSPFNALCPIIIPHKHYGMGWSDQTLTDDRVETVLERQLVNNVIYNGVPDNEVVESGATDETWDALSIEQAGGRNIPVKTPNTIVPIMRTTMIADVAAALDQRRQTRQDRTGIRSESQTDMEPAAATADAQRRMSIRRNKRVRYTARVFAATGIKQLYMDVHRDLRKGPIRDLIIQVEGGYVEVDPRGWRTRRDMSVNVGMTEDNKDAQLGQLQMMLEQQKEMGVGYEHIYETLSRMLALSGFEDTSRFFPTPDEMEQAQAEAAQEEQEPTPEELIGQAEIMKAQATAAKAETDAKLSMIKLQMTQQDERADAMLKQQEQLLDRFKAMTDRMNVLLTDDRERDRYELEERRPSDMNGGGDAVN